MPKILIEADTEAGTYSVKVDGNEVPDVKSAGVMKYKEYGENGQTVDKVGFDVYCHNKTGDMHTSTHIMASKLFDDVATLFNGGKVE